MRKHIFAGLATCAGVLCGGMPAGAIEGPKPVDFDGGPLGTLNFSAGADGYFYLQSGTSSNPHESIAGSKAAGADIEAWSIQLRKSTGLVQFTFQLAETANINLGANKPSQVAANTFTISPIRAAYVSVVPTDELKFSIGQVPSVEGFESAFAWNNPVALRTVTVAGENTNNRGVEADYAHGPFAATLVFGDGYDTGVWNHLQYFGTDKFDPNNSLTIYGMISFGTTGPNTFAYGTGGMSGGGANGNGGQGELAAVNSNMVGGWYTWKNGPLAITPQVQFQWVGPLTKYANNQPGGGQNNIPKGTGNLVASVFGTYNFPDSPFSLGAWGEYARSYGSGPQDSWFVSPNAQLVGFAVAPGYQYKQLFTRLNAGFVHLLNSGTPSAGYGDGGTGKNQGVVTLEFALVY